MNNVHTIHHNTHKWQLITDYTTQSVLVFWCIASVLDTGTLNSRNQHNMERSYGSNVIVNLDDNYSPSTSIIPIVISSRTEENLTTLNLLNIFRNR